VLAGAAGADEAVLRAPIALDLGVLERGPVRLLLAEAARRISPMISSTGNTFELGRTRMSCSAHGRLLLSAAFLKSIYHVNPSSTTPPP